MRSALATLLALAVAAGVARCGGDGGEQPAGDRGNAPASRATTSSKRIRPDPANAGKRITIGSKAFTESITLAHIYGQALEHAGYAVAYRTGLGDEHVATKAMRSGKIDAYPEYTGTALTALLGIAPKDVPKDENRAYELARRRYAEEYGFVAFPQTPFTDSQALGMTRQKARELGNPTKISDLQGKAQDLTLAAPPECFRRTDCALGFRDVYGLEFERQIPIDVSERHEVILRKRADLTIPFTTDGQIAANDEVILADDKNLFPPYNVTFVVTARKATELGPDLEDTITAVQRELTTPAMQELNSRVDLDRKKPAAVARGYLRENGYVE